VDRSRLGIDLRGEPAIPTHEDVPTLVDLVYNPTIPCTQTRVVACILDQLDACSDRDPGTDPCGEKSGTVGIHNGHIGFVAQKLYPLAEVFECRSEARAGEVAPRRRTVPNSTA